VALQELAQQLQARAKEEELELVGDGMLNKLTKTVLETALEAEMDERLGYGKHEVAGAEAETPVTAPAPRAR
jgi:transposase-like protein